MNVEYTANRLPDKLTAYLQVNSNERRFRRRTVLTNGNGNWALVCCTIEGFLPGEALPEKIPSRRYSQARLHEDWLTGAECLTFASELQDGLGHFDDVELKVEKIPQWHTEIGSVNNDYMTRAGTIVGLRFGANCNRTPIGTLLAHDQPYYPDIDEAARDWLPLPIYHGYHDGRNEEVLFLLPEARAFIANAEVSEVGSIDITVSGTSVASLALMVKGAYWQEKSMTHCEGAVAESHALLMVPSDADRLEYYLIDHQNTIYDFHREDRFSRQRGGRSALGAIKRTMVDQVRQAAQDGEGPRIEFKPFVHPERLISANKQKTKLYEVVKTIVAFANTDGGQIYLGIDDDCNITGIEHALREWVKGPADDPAIQRYVGELKSRIKDVLIGDVTVRFFDVQIDDSIVVVIEVPPTTIKLTAIQQDNFLWVRTGASNRKVSPDQWSGVMDSKKPGGLLDLWPAS